MNELRISWQLQVLLSHLQCWEPLAVAAQQGASRSRTSSNHPCSILPCNPPGVKILKYPWPARLARQSPGRNHQGKIWRKPNRKCRSHVFVPNCIQIQGVLPDRCVPFTCKMLEFDNRPSQSLSRSLKHLGWSTWWLRAASPLQKSEGQLVHQNWASQWRMFQFGATDRFKSASYAMKWFS